MGVAPCSVELEDSPWAPTGSGIKTSIIRHAIGRRRFNFLPAPGGREAPASPEFIEFISKRTHCETIPAPAHRQPASAKLAAMRSNVQHGCQAADTLKPDCYARRVFGPASAILPTRREADLTLSAPALPVSPP